MGNCACAAYPDTRRFSSLAQPADTSVALLHLPVPVKMNYLLRADLLTSPASGTSILIHKNQPIILFPVNSPLRTCFHTKPAVYTPFTDILLETFFYNRSNCSAAARIFFLRRLNFIFISSDLHPFQMILYPFDPTEITLKSGKS